MNLDPLEAEVLGWLLENMEAPRTLAKDYASEFGSSTSPASISTALGRLVEMGFAQAYELVPESKTFRPIASRNPPLTAWFMVTQGGREMVQKLP
jgi:hypothetical protein